MFFPRRSRKVSIHIGFRGLNNYPGDKHVGCIEHQPLGGTRTLCMARNEIRTSIPSFPMSLTVVHQDATGSAGLAREVNDYLASLRGQHLAQSGFFASLPSSEDMAHGIGESRYALDKFKADNIVLFTSYNDKYLGSS
ncbi:hypothetical protein BDW62DRAFT_205600 [Aspergillus aurantiobrunneus]